MSATGFGLQPPLPHPTSLSTPPHKHPSQQSSTRQGSFIQWNLGFGIPASLTKCNIRKYDEYTYPALSIGAPQRVLVTFFFLFPHLLQYLPTLVIYTHGKLTILYSTQRYMYIYIYNTVCRYRQSYIIVIYVQYIPYLHIATG